MGVRWLSRRCSVVLYEFATASDENPDVIGWAPGADSVLIECKLTRADFLRDATKAVRRNPRAGMGQRRYYLCPPDVIQVKDLPPKWGLLWAIKGAIKNPAHEGRRCKICWSKSSFKTGLRAKVLLTPDNRQCGFIEYVPGEYAWRGVDARGYLFIHCIWTFSKQYRGKGLASQAIQACLEDAANTGSNGVAVITREQPWLAGAALFLANGFTVVDTAPPDYNLLVRKLNPSAPDPAFQGDWEKKLKRYSRGLTIIQSNQCPHIAKFAVEIAQAAERDYGLKPKIVELKSARQAQNAPTPYAVFAVIYNGRLLADHQISRTRFHNIMRKISGIGPPTRLRAARAKP